MVGWMQREPGLLRLASMLVSAGLLLALGGVLPASAHEFEAVSEITIDASDRSVPPGTFVTFFGEVNSTEPSCEPDREVTLTRTQPDPPTVVGTDTTNASGEWSITVQVFTDSRYRARVETRAEGVHPHRHVCHGDGSGSIRIRVEPGPTPSPSPSPTPSPSPGCKGTSGDDILVGTNGDDRCVGRKGDDDISMLGGNDIGSGGRGNDHIDCGPGNDEAYGGPGTDTFTADCEIAEQ